MSEHRIDYRTFKPGLDSMALLGTAVHDSGLEQSLVELVKVRASQINQCAYCLDMHWKDARSMGESEQRLYGLSAWREAPYYTDRERA
ncbi:MAG: carboxymuconolactone decarboxylase family protein, partial [Actinobacteria bacterium]|nr:carboxymuconolactone decarboxylase family protein [Actinomycetota bacterium]